MRPLWSARLAVLSILVAGVIDQDRTATASPTGEGTIVLSAPTVQTTALVASSTSRLPTGLLTLRWEAPEPGEVRVHECAAPASGWVVEIGRQPVTRSLVIEDDRELCVTSSLAATMRIVRRGQVAVTPVAGGSSYRPINPVGMLTSFFSFKLQTFEWHLPRPSALDDALGGSFLIELTPFRFAPNASLGACGAVPPVSDLVVANDERKPAAAIVNVRFGPGDQPCVNVSGEGRIRVVLLGTFDDSMTASPTRPPELASLVTGIGGRHLVLASPVRLLDTRWESTRVEPDRPLVIETPTDPLRTARLLQITATRATAAGFVRVAPCAGPVPATSDLNYPYGADRSTLVFVPEAVDGRICVETSSTTDLVVDEIGRWEAVAPGATLDSPVLAMVGEARRVVDTRVGLGADRLAEGRATEVGQFGDSAVIATATVTRAAASGYLGLSGCGAATGETSQVNFSAVEDVANVVVLPAGPVCAMSSAATDLVIDISASVRPSSTGALEIVPPVRLLDTRDRRGAERGRTVVPIAGSIPHDATAVVVRLMATRAQDAGFATVSSCDGPVPPTSNLNFRRDEDISNLAIVELGTSRSVCVDTSAPTQLILDLVAAVR